ncbi:MAG: hypothetical protein IPF94_07095 [Betaproteobacteria bacterium]|nr:hypothetical protein [Betaproteobacteria bacterium]
MPNEPATIDGAWHAYSDGMGSTLSLSLASEAGAVTGSGTYTRGTLSTGTLRAAGQFRAPTLTLELTYDHGERVVLTATLTGPERMTGQLTDKSGSVVKLELARP